MVKISKEETRCVSSELYLSLVFPAKLWCLRGCFFRSCTSRAVAFAFFYLAEVFFLKDGQGWKPKQEQLCWAGESGAGQSSWSLGRQRGRLLPWGCSCHRGAAALFAVLPLSDWPQINSAWQSTRIQLAAWPSSAGRLSSEPQPCCCHCQI